MSCQTNMTHSQSLKSPFFSIVILGLKFSGTSCFYMPNCTGLLLCDWLTRFVNRYSWHSGECYHVDLFTYCPLPLQSFWWRTHRTTGWRFGISHPISNLKSKRTGVEWQHPEGLTMFCAVSWIKIPETVEAQVRFICYSSSNFLAFSYVRNSVALKNFSQITTTIQFYSLQQKTEPKSKAWENLWRVSGSV